LRGRLEPPSRGRDGMGWRFARYLAVRFSGPRGKVAGALMLRTLCDHWKVAERVTGRSAKHRVNAVFVRDGRQAGGLRLPASDVREIRATHPPPTPGSYARELTSKLR